MTHETPGCPLVVSEFTYRKAGGEKPFFTRKFKAEATIVCTATCNEGEGIEPQTYGVEVAVDRLTPLRAGKDAVATAAMAAIRQRVRCPFLESGEL